MSNYRKSIVAVIGASLTWGALVVTSPQAAISASEWLSLAGGLATALGVYTVVNTK